jgi:hypothetical protein
MKKVFSIWSIAILMVMSVGFSSCDKDDDEGSGNKDFSKQLVGKWEYHSYYYSGWIEVDGGNYIQFNSDGSLSFSNYKTWEVIGQGTSSYGEYGDSYKVALKGHATDDDAIWDICVIGKSISPQIEGYDYPDILAISRPGNTRYVRVK